MLAPGTILGGCRLEAVIGRGGMGVVYRARQLDLDRDVAVKVIAPELVEDEQTRTRFLTEARAAGAVEHPNVVPVHGVGIADDRAYLVMRYVAGDDLRTLVRRDGALAPEQAADVVSQLGDALDAIHRAGYVHRDVKPQNVMIGPDGHVYLSDFGLAKEALATSGPTTSEHWVGTLDYVAPEQIRGERVDARADVYALGGVLYFMLTGRVPFDRPTDEAKLWAHLHDPAPGRRRRGPGCRTGSTPSWSGRWRRTRTCASRRPATSAGPRAPRRRAGRRPDRGHAAASRHPGAARPPRPAVAGARRARRRRRRSAGCCCATTSAGRRRYRRRRRGGQRPRPPPAPEPHVGLRVPASASGPARVLVAGGAVWVLSIHEERLTRLDPDTGSRRRVQPFVGVGAARLRRARGHGCGSPSARRAASSVMDARSGELVERIPVPLPPVHVAAGRERAVGRRAHGAGGPGRPAPLRPDGHATAGRADGVPRRDRGDHARRGRGVGGARAPEADHARRAGRLAGARRRGSTSPRSELAYGDGHVWASVRGDDSVARIDPRTEQVVHTEVGGSPAGIALAGGRVFVASNTRHRVLVLDPVRFRRGAVQALRVPPNPYAVTAGGGHVWVAGIGGHTVTRIDY